MAGRQGVRIQAGEVQESEDPGALQNTQTSIYLMYFQPQTFPILNIYAIIFSFSGFLVFCFYWQFSSCARKQLSNLLHQHQHKPPSHPFWKAHLGNLLSSLEFYMKQSEILISWSSCMHFPCASPYNLQFIFLILVLCISYNMLFLIVFFLVLEILITHVNPFLFCLHHLPHIFLALSFYYFVVIFKYVCRYYIHGTLYILSNTHTIGVFFLEEIHFCNCQHDLAVLLCSVEVSQPFSNSYYKFSCFSCSYHMQPVMLVKAYGCSF